MATASKSSLRKKPAAARPSGAGPKPQKKPAKADGAEGEGGEDTEGAKYQKLSDLWDAELQGTKGRESWYAKATTYWQGQESSINGVLGGYPETHAPDLRESRRFVDLLRRCGALATERGAGTALDCGAGIGRVTGGLLRHEFGEVDLVEPNKRLLGTAKRDLRDDGRVKRFTACSLQELDITGETYDCVWAQWVLLYLPDDDLVAFLQRCIRGLRSGGLICVKENVVCNGGSFIVDKEDNSVSRTDDQYKAVFEKAGLEVLHELQQTCWPPNLIPVMMYALRPTAADAAVREEEAAVKIRPTSASGAS